MKEAFVGFDSAWSVKNKGAISYAIFQDGVPEKARMENPRPASFDDAAEIIEELQKECHDVLVAIDQPIIVPNHTASRPVDGVARSLMSRLRSGVQSANRNKESLFGDEAPIWEFISDTGSCKYSGTTDHAACNPIVDFEAAKTATGQTHLIEVYPALALPALEPKFMARKYAARYNPRNKKKFCLADWRRVCETVHRHADKFGLQPLSKWAKEMAALKSPKKPHQDGIDAAICLIIALRWRREGESHELTVIGDRKSGFMVTPTSCDTRGILKRASEKVGI